MESSRDLTLSAQVHIIVQEIGKGAQKRGVRRPLLVDGRSGLLYELQTVYLYRNLAQKSLNTQRATLRDLAFYLEWVSLKRDRNSEWVTPEERVSKNQLALSRKEIDDLSRWCLLFSSELVRVRNEESASIRGIPAGRTVDVATTNSRLRNIGSYLVWLTEEFIEGSLKLEDDLLAKSEKYKNIINACIERNLSGIKKSPPVLSLDDSQSKALVEAIKSNNIFSSSAHGTRDRLIARLLYESGIRPGELLKLRCDDVNDSYKVKNGRLIGLITIVRRPNDPLDERKVEPSVKTLPGPVTISRRLASDIILYITNERRISIDRRGGTTETPYLFVCHSGPEVGRPISQRNLNRIIAKLKKVKGLPEWIRPHIFRHTHFTQLADSAYENNISCDDVILSRGHWSPGSKMPARYSQRHIIEKSNELTSLRDKIISGDDDD